MAKLLQKHSKPVAEHVFAAFLWDILRWGVPTLVTWLTAHLASLRGWALPYVILIGAAVFALVSVGTRRFGSPAREARQEPSTTDQEIDFEKQTLDEALTRRSAEVASLTEQLKASQDQLLGHSRLIRTAVDDKAAIKDLVMVCIVRCSTEMDEGDPHVAFTFHVLNMSLYPISVESVQGLIKFSRTLNYARKRIPLRLPRSDGVIDNLAQHIPFRQTGSFTICQPLTPENAVFVGALEGLFWLSDLTITVTGDDFETFAIPSGTVYVQKDRDWYASNPESYFIYRDTVRAEAKLRAVEAGETH